MANLINAIKTILFIAAITITVTSGSSGSSLFSIHSYWSTMDGPTDSLVVDSVGNRYPVKKLLDNKLWMTTNLQLNIQGSYCYENVQLNCAQYGRLYTWEAARQGCTQLGNGWRLPTHDEWKQLITYYGGLPADSLINRKAAYKALMLGGLAQFNALLGGGRNPDGTYKRLDAHGFYWTQTENDESKSIYYNFGKGSQALYTQMDGEKSMALSVRCVK